MQIQIRRGKFFNHGCDLFEFQFPKNNRWYTINRNSIYLFADGPEHIRKFYNALYSGETLQVRAAYFRGLKLLAIEFLGGDKA